MYLNLATLGTLPAILVFDPRGRVNLSSLCSNGRVSNASPLHSYLAKDLAKASEAFRQNATEVAPRAAAFYQAKETQYFASTRAMGISMDDLAYLKKLRDDAYAKRGSGVSAFVRLLLSQTRIKIGLVHLVDWNGNLRGSPDEIIKAISAWPTNPKTMNKLWYGVILTAAVVGAYLAIAKGRQGNAEKFMDVLKRDWTMGKGMFSNYTSMVKKYAAQAKDAVSNAWTRMAEGPPPQVIESQQNRRGPLDPRGRYYEVPDPTDATRWDPNDFIQPRPTTPISTPAMEPVFDIENMAPMTTKAGGGVHFTGEWYKASNYHR